MNLLLDPQRDLPVVVVSTRSNGQPSSIDAESIAAATESAAQTWVVPTGRLTYRMRDLLTDGAHVYGGAGRVYPPGAAWLQDLALSPLRLAFDDHGGNRATMQLIDDVHRSAEVRHVTPNATIADRLDVDLSAFKTELASDGQARPPAASPPGALRDALLAVEAKSARIRELERALADERRQHVAEVARLRDAARVASLSRPERPASKVKPVVPDAAPPGGLQLDAFPTEEDAVRHAVLVAWVDRVPALEKRDRPLPDYRVGQRFAASLVALDSGQFAKAMKCAIDVLTNRGKDLTAGAIHPLRSHDAGNAPAVTRLDGSVCFRAAIERSTASARRLHYWRSPDGTIELERVVTHDEMRP